MPTPERLYYCDSFLTNFSATVTDIREARREEGRSVWEIALDRTAFYPTSGGQPHDFGTLFAQSRSGANLEAEIFAVEEDDAGEVWHSSLKPLNPGTPVTGHVDFDRRFDHAQQHSGQHLLSALFFRELNLPTVSFHLGSEVSTIDLEGASAERLTDSVLERIESVANSIIFEDRQVTIRIVPQQEAENLLTQGAVRRLPGRSGDIRLIEIENLDLNACGGTHVRSTGQIGVLLLRGVEKVRAGLRISFVCGGRAVRAARSDFHLLEQSAQMLSSQAQALPELIANLQQENKSQAKQHQVLLTELAEYEARDLAAETAASPPLAPSGLRFLSRVIPGAEAGFLKSLASRIAAQSRSAFFLLANSQGEVVLARSASFAANQLAPAPSELDCGSLLKTHLATLGSRGGGSASLAQGRIESEKTAALIEKIRSAIAEISLPPSKS